MTADGVASACSAGKDTMSILLTLPTLREAQERHTNHYLHRAVSAAEDSRTLDETVMSALEADQGNFRLALGRLADNGEITDGFSLAKALMTMWTRRGYDY